MTERNDLLVAEYLAQVSRATANLPPDRRDELISDLREHIEARRAEAPVETEAQIRDIIGRLGDPDVIARAAAEDAAPPTGHGSMSTVAGGPAGWVHTPAWPTRRVRTTILTIIVIVALLALFAGLFFFAQSGETGAAT